MNFLFWLLHRLPPRFLRALLRTLAGLAYALGIRRFAARRSVALAFPELTEREHEAIVRANYLHLGECAADFLRSPRMRDEELFSLVDAADFAKVKPLIEQRRGFVVATAHFGCFELFGVWAARVGVPLVILTKQLRGRANAAWVETRALAGIREIHKGWQNLFDTVRRGDTLALLIDQNMIRRRAVFVPFFGLQAATTPAPARVAHETGAPVVLALLQKTAPGHYKLVIEGPFDFEPRQVPPGEDAAAALQADFEAFTAMLNARLEAHVRAHPEQWFWVHRRFKTRPSEADEDLYSK